MESDLKTALTASLVRNKSAEMDIADYITCVHSITMEKENELFFQEFLCDSESNQIFDHQPIEETKLLSLADSKDFEKHYSNIMLPEKNVKTEFKISSVSSGISNFIESSNTRLVQPVITMKTLNEIIKIPIDSGYNTNDWKIDPIDSNDKPIEIMSQSIQKALELFTITLFDYSQLLEAVTYWNDCNNLVKYFVDLVSNMSDSIEFVFTCRDYVMMFVQNISFKILDNHQMYNSIHVEYQCNLLATICYDKYIRWNLINLLLNRLKIDIQIIPSSSCLRSIYYTFHLIDKLLNKVDFIATTTIKNRESLYDLWKLNQTNTNGSRTEISEQLKEWTNLLEHISMEALRKDVFLVSIRANQCLESLKSLSSK